MYSNSKRQQQQKAKQNKNLILIFMSFYKNLIVTRIRFFFLIDKQFILNVFKIS